MTSPVGLTVAGRPRRVAPVDIIGFVAHLVLLLVVLADSARFAPHADNLWQLNLVRQLRQNSRKAVVFVDANRVFPDLLVATGLDRVWSAAGQELSGSAFARFVAIINVVLLFLVSRGVRRSFGAPAAALTSLVVLVLFTTNEYFLELLRPGFHTMASLLLLNWLLRRFVPDRSLGWADIALVSAVCISSRIYLVMLVFPCVVVLFCHAAPGRRIRRSMPMLVAAVVSVIGWLAVLWVPGVSVAVFGAQLQFGALPGVLQDVARNGVGRRYLNQATPVWVRLDWFFWTLALVTLAAAIRLLSRRRRALAGPRVQVLIAVAAVSLVVGTVSMRLVNYVVDHQMYVLILPVLLCAVVTGVAGARFLGDRRATTFALAAFALAASVLGVGNGLAITRSGTHARYSTVAALLEREGVLDKPGLATFWPAYELAVAGEGIDVRMVGEGANPLFWVNNPWDVFRVPGTTDRYDQAQRFSWVLAVASPDEVGPTSTIRSLPSRAAVTEMFGAPTRTVTGVPRSGEQTPVLYLYDAGTETGRFRQMWKAGMDERGLDIHS